MNYEIIEDLSDREILKLYDDVLEGNENEYISVWYACLCNRAGRECIGQNSYCASGCCSNISGARFSRCWTWPYNTRAPYPAC